MSVKEKKENSLPSVKKIANKINAAFFFFLSNSVTETEIKCELMYLKKKV